MMLFVLLKLIIRFGRLEIERNMRIQNKNRGKIKLKNNNNNNKSLKLIEK